MLKSKWATKPESTNSTPPPAATESSPVTTQAKSDEQPGPPPPNAEAHAAPSEEPYVPAASDMPPDYQYPDASIDPFAQTAGTDDLFFDDDFIPVAEPVVEQEPVPVPAPEPESEEEAPAGGLGQSQHAQQTQQAQHVPRGPANGERGGRGRGRARGRGRGRGGIHNAQTQEPKEKLPQEKDAKPDDVPTETTTTASSTTEPTTTDISTPTAPKDAKPTHSVRGDRTLTGGTPRTRLTESELAAKLATMRSKNSALTAAHARAEADQQSFEAREAVAARQNAERRKQAQERQKQERQDRQQMMGERERNRQRKLEAQGGREWDFEKGEGFAGTGDERRRGAARGAHGGVAPSTRPTATEGSSEPVREDSSIPPSGRGRGRGRGGRGGGREGRGDHHHANTPKKDPSVQQPPKASDFPELPTKASSTTQEPTAPKTLDFPNKPKSKTETVATQSAEPERPSVKKQESFGLPSPIGAGKSWADQVEGS